jgi:hypothetical protein
VTSIARISTLAVLALAAMHGAAMAAPFDSSAVAGSGSPMCAPPVTKSYFVQPGFCPQHLVAMIPQAVSGDACGECCGPFGIPSIYAAGGFVMVRQSHEGQEQVAKFLTDLGAYKPVMPAQ